MENRVKKIFENLESKPDAIIIKNSGEPFIDDNFFYVTGLEQGLFEGCTAVLFPDGKIELVVSELESEVAYKSNATVSVYKSMVEYQDVLKNIIGSLSLIGLNFNGITYKDLQKLKSIFSNPDFLDVSQALSKSRAIKDKEEIEKIKQAAKIVDYVVEKIPDIVHHNMKEYELAAEIDYLMMKNGADRPGFDTISSFGKNSSQPHYTHGSSVLNIGDFVLCDFGACFKKYNSDITRTFVFGKPSEKQEKMHGVVRSAQEKAFEKIMPGVKGKEVHNLVESFINSSDFAGRFIHSTGHSLGIAVHDGGLGLGPESDVELLENMVLTVEPGIYIPGFGGVRIEDDILVTKNGLEILTKSNRDLIEIF